MGDIIAYLRHYPDLVEWIGVAGFFVYIIGFFLVQARMLCGNSDLFSISQICAALLVLISLSTEFNLASFMIQVSYATIGALGVLLRKLRLQARPSRTRLRRKPIRFRSINDAADVL